VRFQRYDIGIDLRGDLRHIFFLLALGGVSERVSSDRTGGRRLLTRAWTYDSALHEVGKNAAIVALLGVTGEPKLSVPAPDELPADLEQAVASASGPRGFLALSLRGNEENRSWPLDHAVSFVKMAWSRLQMGTVYIGGGNDRSLGEAIRERAAVPMVNLAGRSTLAHVLAILHRASGAVTVDSGPMHLAAAVGCPQVALFGPGDPRECGPWNPRASVVSAGAPCACVHPRCDYGPGPGRCMTNLASATVLEAFERVVGMKR
jgi:ADP-heptose:LPS heptosyltransferase